MSSARLSAYRAKRDFSRTLEPRGERPPHESNRFVVHKHHATAAHYDLRLELDGVLRSWAVPRGPSLDPAEKRLAVETEDHPVDYLDFEGLIPEGEYGGGPMIVWDQGTWAPMEDPREALAKGAFKFRLSGEKLKGGWMLARLKPRPGDRNVSWLLFKENDPAARKDGDILLERPESVKSGRLIEDLLPRTQAAPKAARLRPGALKGAVRAPMRKRYEPQLARSAELPPDGRDWLHEIKLDGYRTMAHLEAGSVRLITRSGLDWTARYGDLGEAFARLACSGAVIDGEIVVLDRAGVSRFGLLQEALSRGETHRLVFFAFDLLHLDGWDLMGVALERRKQLLSRLLAAGRDATSAILYCDHVEGEGEALFERAGELGLEGVVCKRRSAPYLPGRSDSWLKVKARRSRDFIIAGYTESEAAGGLAALGVAERSGGELHYRGKVGSGFDVKALPALLDRLRGLRDGAARLAGMPKGMIPVRPELVANVQYSDITTGNVLRQAVFRGLREPQPVVAKGAGRRRLISDAALASVWVTNPDRRLFGQTGPTKLDIAVYYAAVGDFMLPHILGRPVSLLRCPTGVAEESFFQRHPFTGMPATIGTFETRNSEGEVKRYISVEDVASYLALAQFGVVEFHAWGALARRVDRPDRMVLDLDPGEGITWREVTEAALHIRDELGRLGLAAFAKTSGGKGVHVVVPVRPRLAWKEFHCMASDIAARIARTAPDTFTTVMGKQNRRRRIFIDYNRNARGATAAAPYSLRLRPGLPVSMPLAWNDLESIDVPEDLNYHSAPRLLEASGDPWADINKFTGDLPKSLQSRHGEE